MTLNLNDSGRKEILYDDVFSTRRVIYGYITNAYEGFLTITPALFSEVGLPNPMAGVHSIVLHEDSIVSIRDKTGDDITGTLGAEMQADSYDYINLEKVVEIEH